MKNYLNLSDEIKIPLEFSLITLFSILFIFLTACSEDNNTNPEIIDKGDFTIQAKYDSIRSYPNGCGVFILYITTTDDFEGNVKLKMKSVIGFNYKFTNVNLNSNILVSELIIYPNEKVQFRKHQLEVIAIHGGKEVSIKLYVEIFHWGEGSTFETAIEKRDEFKNWLTTQYPKYSSIFDDNSLIFHTYPEVLIVEHYTFLTEDYEVRVCYHVMIPPDDWSMIRIRKRNTLEPEFAAKRESDGKISQIQLKEYPVMFGY